MDPINPSTVCEALGVGEVDKVSHRARGYMVYKYAYCA